MLAPPHTRPATLLEGALWTVVKADAGTPAYLALYLAPSVVMLAYRRPFNNSGLAASFNMRADRSKRELCNGLGRATCPWGSGLGWRDGC